MNCGIKSAFFLAFFGCTAGYTFNVEEIFNFIGGGKTNPLGYFNVDKRDLFFHLYTKKFPYPREVDESNLDLIEDGKPVKMLLHGWVGNENIRTYQNITKEYFKKGDYNIIHVDWRNVGVLPYAVAAGCSKDVAKVIQSFLINLHVKKGIPLETVHLIGISLGAHIAGFTGKQIKKQIGKKIGRITGLDPAGPLFEFPPTKESDRLARDDATIVDVIHTDGGVVGVLKPTGTIDFYPNGGVRPQKGCPFTPNEDKTKLDEVALNFFCGHYQAVVYFIKSINSKDFVGVQCSSWIDFKLGHCNGNTKNIMGENLIPEQKGSYYLIMK